MINLWKKKENLEFEKKVEKIKEFDIILGNPPFQNTDENEKRKAILNNLWSLFLYYSYNLIKTNGYLLFINPTGWMTNGFKYKDFLYKNWLIFLNINECNKWFPSVGSQFSYYLIQKTIKKKKQLLYVNIIKKFTNLNYYYMIIQNLYHHY